MKGTSDGIKRDDYEGFISREEHVRALDAKQAQLDELMLEYCPGEMTEAQLEEWAKHQTPVAEVVNIQIKAALAHAGLSSSSSKGSI